MVSNPKPDSTGQQRTQVSVDNNWNQIISPAAIVHASWHERGAAGPVVVTSSKATRAPFPPGGRMGWNQPTPNQPDTASDCTAYAAW